LPRAGDAAAAAAAARPSWCAQQRRQLRQWSIAGCGACLLLLLLLLGLRLHVLLIPLLLPPAALRWCCQRVLLLLLLPGAQGSAALRGRRARQLLRTGRLPCCWVHAWWWCSRMAAHGGLRNACGRRAALEHVITATWWQRSTGNGLGPTAASQRAIGVT
jgi:hypothetical protein